MGLRFRAQIPIPWRFDPITAPHSIHWTPIPTTPVNLSRQQPDHSITPSSPQSVLEAPQGSIAELLRASPLVPLNVSFMRVLDDKLREDCLKELSDPNTFLTDTTVNAFGVIVNIAT